MSENLLNGDARAIVSALKEHKGQHQKITWCRSMKTLKTAGEISVTKRTSAYVRAGIDYANLKTVQTGIETGERGEVQALPWGEWSEFPFIISHKGKDYLRLYPASFDNLRPSVEYAINGIPATKEDCQPLCLASEFRDSEDRPECFTIKVESLVSIG